VDIQTEYTDVQLAMPHKIIKTKATDLYNPDIKLDAFYYLFQKSEKEIAVISFQTLFQQGHLNKENADKVTVNSELFCNFTL
jgi:hypothetical protein